VSLILRFFVYRSVLIFKFIAVKTILNRTVINDIDKRENISTTVVVVF